MACQTPPFANTGLSVRTAVCASHSAACLFAEWSLGCRYPVPRSQAPQAHPLPFCWVVAPTSQPFTMIHSISIVRGTSQRTTVPLLASVGKVTFHPNHEASLALAYAQAWVLRTGIPKVPPSGVIRRALRHYADHLSSLTTTADREHEARMLRRATQSIPVDECRKRSAWDRLSSVAPDQPLPTFHEVHAGTEGRELVARLDQRLPSRRSSKAAPQ